MSFKFEGEFGKVWVIDDNKYVLEKYYNTLDILLIDEALISEEIYELEFSILKRKILSVENPDYRRVVDKKGIYTETNGPLFIWCLRFNLQYFGK